MLIIERNVGLFALSALLVFGAIAFYTIYFSNGYNYYDETLNVRTDSSRNFPVDENGVRIEYSQLPIQEQRKLYIKIKNHNPELDAIEAFREKDFRFMAWPRVPWQRYVGIPCNSYEPSRVKLILYFKYDENKNRDYDVGLAWLDYGTRYNRKLFSLAKKIPFNGCYVRSI